MATIRIGSFNVKNLSEGTGRDLARIAKMINHYELDIVALQEVLSEGRVIHNTESDETKGVAKYYNDALTKHLLGEWDSVWRQPQVRGKNEKYLGTDQRGEGYALLWRTDKFELPACVQLSDRQKKIYEVLEKCNGMLTAEELAEKFDISAFDVQRDIKTLCYALAKQGFTQRIVFDTASGGYHIVPQPSKARKTKIIRDRSPQIYSNYHAAQDGLRLIRDPLYARLILKEKKVVELRIIVAHLIYGKPTISGGSDDFTIDEGAIALRRKEFNTLAGKIYQRISEDHAVRECTVPYTLLMGDYNLNLKYGGAGGPYLTENQYECRETLGHYADGTEIVAAVAFFDEYGHLVSSDVPEEKLKQFCRETGERQGGSVMRIYTAQSQLSTLKRDESGYANNYDHFSFDDRVKSRASDIKNLRALHEFVGDSDAEFDTYKSKVSDHVPIIIELNL